MSNGKGRGPEKGVNWGKFRDNFPHEKQAFELGTIKKYFDKAANLEVEIRYLGVIKIQGKIYHEFENITNPESNIDFCFDEQQIKELK